MYNEEKHLRLFSDGLARYEDMKSDIDLLVRKAKSVHDNKSPFAVFLYKSKRN